VTVTELTRPALVELLLSEAAQALTEMSGRLIRVETIAAYPCARRMVVGLLDARRLGTRDGTTDFAPALTG
jgi:hypothetical protein